MKKLEWQVWIWLKDDVETAKQIRGYQVDQAQMDVFLYSKKLLRTLVKPSDLELGYLELPDKSNSSNFN